MSVDLGAAGQACQADLQNSDELRPPCGQTVRCHEQWGRGFLKVSRRGANASPAYPAKIYNTIGHKI